MAGAALFSAALFSAAAVSSASAATAPLPGTGRAVSWWWDTPPSADDPAVAATLEFCTQHRDIVTTLIMRCNVLTCCRAGTGECGNAVNHSIPRGSCTNNKGVGGVLTGEVSPACKKMIPALTALGIRSELWLGEDDAMSSARYLFAHAEETAADLLAVAKANPGYAFNPTIPLSFTTPPPPPAHTHTPHTRAPARHYHHHSPTHPLTLPRYFVCLSVLG